MAMYITKNIKRRMAEKRLTRITDNANVLFQVREHDGALWLTYADNLVLPCSMLNIAPIDALSQMRSLYTSRLTDRQP